MTIDDKAIDRWLKNWLTRVDTKRRRPRRCRVCREMGADPMLGVHPGRCHPKEIKSLEKALALSRSPERRRFRQKREVWKSRIRAHGGQLGRLSFSQFRDRWNYYGGRCWMCGGAAEATDHVIPLSKGGAGWPSNLRPACRSCKARKQNRATADFANSVPAFVTWCRSLGSRDQAALRMHRVGKSLRVIGRELGMSQEGVRRVVERHDPRGRPALPR